MSVFSSTAHVDATAFLAAVNNKSFTNVEYLGQLINGNTPKLPHRSHGVEIQQIQPGNGITFHDDRHVGHIGVGTHIDGLGHVAHNSLHHGDVRTEDVFQANGLKALGICENFPAIVAPFKLIDLARAAGTECLPAGMEVTRKELRDAVDAQNVQVDRGDVLLLRTGWTKHRHDHDVYVGPSPGPGLDAARLLAEASPRLIASDTGGFEVERLPEERGSSDFAVHRFLLQKHGILLGEAFNLESLARQKVRQGVIIIAPPLIGGLAQAQVNPIVMF